MESTKQSCRECLLSNPPMENEGRNAYLRRISQLCDNNYASVDKRYRDLVKRGTIKKVESVKNIVVNDKKDQGQEIKEKILKLAKRGDVSIKDLCNSLYLPPLVIEKAITELKNERYLIDIVDENIEIVQPKSGLKHSLNKAQWQGNMLKIGFTADNHMCSHYSREDVLNMIYDVFQSEGVHHVFNAGNWIDGEARFNKNDIFVRGLTKQTEYCANNYPERDGVTTHFIAGDDHEGWYTQNAGINIGEYLQLKREQLGRRDMKYLGYMEADIDINGGEFENKQYLRLIHPGGGSSYAYSYKPQKIVESYGGGEKPSILGIGHYHKAGYNNIRNVHTVQIPCTEDQTTFMRKHSIGAYIGGLIMEIYRDDSGIITRVKTDFINVFDRTFYMGNNKYLK